MFVLLLGFFFCWFFFGGGVVVGFFVCFCRWRFGSFHWLLVGFYLYVCFFLFVCVLGGREVVVVIICVYFCTRVCLFLFLLLAVCLLDCLEVSFLIFKQLAIIYILLNITTTLFFFCPPNFSIATVLYRMLALPAVTHIGKSRLIALPLSVIR